MANTATYYNSALTGAFSGATAFRIEVSSNPSSYAALTAACVAFATEVDNQIGVVAAPDPATSEILSSLCFSLWASRNPPSITAGDYANIVTPLLASWTEACTALLPTPAGPAGPPTGPAGGQLSGNYPDPNVNITISSVVAGTNAAATGIGVSTGTANINVSQTGHSHQTYLGAHETWGSDNQGPNVVIGIYTAGNSPSYVAADPIDSPRTISLAFSLAWDGGNVTVYGYDVKGLPITEVVNAIPGFSNDTLFAFSTVTNIVPALTPTAGQTVTASTGVFLGLANYPITGLARALVNHVYDGSYTIDTSHGTILFGQATHNKSLEVWYYYPVTSNTANANVAVSDLGHSHGVSDPTHTHVQNFHTHTYI